MDYGIQVVKKLCPQNKYPIKCPFTRTPTRVVIHNTANDAPAANEISYMLNRPEEVSFHFAVDDKGAVQGLPLDRNAWASGDGRGRGNMEGIHIEICYSLSGGERFCQAEENAAKLTAGLLRQYGWGLDRVCKHQDFDGKYCPHRTLDLGWRRFLRLVEKNLTENKKEEMKMDYAAFVGYMERYRQEAGRAVSPWAKAAWEKAEQAGVLDGAGPGLPLTREQCAVVLDRLGLLG